MMGYLLRDEDDRWMGGGMIGGRGDDSWKGGG